MKIIYKVGDLLGAEERFLVHGCNAQGRMGSGVAKAIRDRYPDAYEDYRQAYETDGLTLGQTIWSWCDPHTVINAITQEFYGYDGARYVDYDAVRTVFTEINTILGDAVLLQGSGGRMFDVAMPLIGAGLAGGDWTVISSIIEEVSTSFQPVVYVLKESDLP